MAGGRGASGPLTCWFGRGESSKPPPPRRLAGRNKSGRASAPGAFLTKAKLGGGRLGARPRDLRDGKKGAPWGVGATADGQIRGGYSVRLLLTPPQRMWDRVWRSGPPNRRPTCGNRSGPPPSPLRSFWILPAGVNKCFRGSTQYPYNTGYQTTLKTSIFRVGAGQRPAATLLPPPSRRKEKLGAPPPLNVAGPCLAEGG